MRKYALVGAAVFGAFALGWFLHKPGSGVNASPTLNPTQTAAIRILSDLVGRLQKHDAAVTAESQRLLALNKVWRDSLAKVQPQPGRDTVWIREATTPRDSAQRCSVVLLDCQRRADLAERRADVLQVQLEKQVGLQPHRMSWLAITPGAGWWPNQPVRPAVCVGPSLRIF